MSKSPGMNTVRVAIVGAGPAGIYAADLLLKAQLEVDVEIDLFEQLPAPYGLVRYGVSPDHPRIKGIVTALREVLDRGDIRLFGNVRFGEHLTLDELRRHFHAVIFATGSARDAELEIPGIDAGGSYGAADFVSWFDGHPDVPRSWPLDARHIGVVGNGNVALDVSRMLVKHADDLLPTEIPDNVYAGLAANPVEEVHVFGRRGPAHVRFTPLELRELGEVRDVDIVLDERDFEVPDPAAERALGSNKQQLVLMRIMTAWRERQRAREAGEVPAATRRLVLHFWSKPIEVVTEGGRVAGLRVERTAPDELGRVHGTGVTEVVPVQALYRAVGYRGSPLPGVPFDAERGVVPNRAGRVIAEDGQPMPGVYATGWIKRGPVGLIGHTKSDAMETVESLLADRASWWVPEDPDPAAVSALLESRGVPVTTVDGWHRLDEHELRLGETTGRARVKVVSREDMTRISRA